MKILRVNMGRLETRLEDLPQEWLILGGRGLSAKILTREVPPDADPLGESAKLIIAAGPLAGTLAPSCGRISVGAKSPLTMGIKEANAGGPAGQDLDKLGIRAIVVEGAPKDKDLYALIITREGARLQKAPELRGMGNYTLVDALKKIHGRNISVISIGPIGERQWKAASVVFTDMDGHPSRNAARGGLGAVMGAKGLKAIVIDDSGSGPVSMANRDAYKETLKAWTQFIKEEPQLQRFSAGGTPLGVRPLRSLGSMPSRNYSSEQTEGFEKISGEAIAEINKVRGGGMAGCMPGCLVKCSVIYNDPEGNHLTSSYEYETLALLGTNLGLSDPDVVATMDRICDDLGIDTIELGSAMGVAASCGKMKMGDTASAMSLLREVEEGKGFGITLGNGVVATCQALGVTRIPAFRGQAIPAHDPRATKACGVTYSTSPMGADHTAGLSYEDSLSKVGQVERSFQAQVMSALRDSMGYCLLASPRDQIRLKAFLRDLIKARYGLTITDEDLLRIGRETLKDELRFNETSGFDKNRDPVPAFLRNEPLAPTGSVFDVDMSEIETIWSRL